MDNANILEKGLIVDYLKDFEKFYLGKADAKGYVDRQVRRAERLWEMFPDNQLYHLMQAAALIRAGKKEEGERILKKYERNHVLQFRNSEFRACLQAPRAESPSTMKSSLSSAFFARQSTNF